MLDCSTPGCSKRFHAICVGHGKATEKELNKLFFVCLRCEAYLNYSAEIARKSIISDIDMKLEAIKIAIYETVDQKIALI